MCVLALLWSLDACGEFRPLFPSCPSAPVWDEIGATLMGSFGASEALGEESIRKPAGCPLPRSVEERDDSPWFLEFMECLHKAPEPHALQAVPAVYVPGKPAANESGPARISGKAAELERAGLAHLLNEWAVFPSRLDPDAVLAQLRDPLDSAEVTSGFGVNRNGKRHLGIDLRGAAGTPVYASCDGRVVFAGRLPGFEAYGQIVVMDHGAGIFTLYGHVKPAKELTQSRKKVYTPLVRAAGDRIAVIGSTSSDEASSGAHLHFELLRVGSGRNGSHFTLLNPARYMPGVTKASAPVFGDRVVVKSASAYGKPMLHTDGSRGILCVLRSLHAGGSVAGLTRCFPHDPRVTRENPSAMPGNRPRSIQPLGGAHYGRDGVFDLNTFIIGEHSLRTRFNFDPFKK